MGRSRTFPEARDWEQLASRLMGNFGTEDADGQPINYQPWWFSPACVAREFHIPLWKAFQCEQEPPIGSEWDNVLLTIANDLINAEITAGVHSSQTPQQFAETVATIFSKMFGG